MNEEVTVTRTHDHVPVPPLGQVLVDAHITGVEDRRDSDGWLVLRLDNRYTVHLAVAVGTRAVIIREDPH